MRKFKVVSKTIDAITGEAEIRQVEEVEAKDVEDLIGKIKITVIGIKEYMEAGCHEEAIDARRRGIPFSWDIEVDRQHKTVRLIWTTMVGDEVRQVVEYEFDYEEVPYIKRSNIKRNCVHYNSIK